MAFSLDQAMQGFGVGLHQVGTENMRAAILAERDQNLARLQAERDARQNQFTAGQAQISREHQTGERVGGQDFQRTMETDVRQPFATAQQERGFGHATEMQERGFGHAEGMQERGFEQQKGLQTSSQEFTGKENDKNRALDQQRLRMEGARLGLAQQQFGLARQQAALAIESGTIDLNKKKALQEIEGQIKNATDPEQIEALTRRYYTALGKDRILVTKTTDEMGRSTETVRDAHTGQPIEQRKPPATPAAGDIEGLRKRAGDPNAITFFESKFGPGSAARYVEQRKTEPATARTASPASPASTARAPEESYINVRRGGFVIEAPSRSPVARLNGRSFSSREEALQAIRSLYE